MFHHAFLPNDVIGVCLRYMPEDVWGVGHNIDRCISAVPPANLVSRLLVGAEKKIARYLLFAHAKNLDPPEKAPPRSRYFEIFGPPWN